MYTKLVRHFSIQLAIADILLYNYRLQFARDHASSLQPADPETIEIEKVQTEVVTVSMQGGGEIQGVY